MMRGRCAWSPRAGFTLLEVLIAVSLFGVAVSIVYFLYNAMVATVERVEERTSRNDQVRIVFERINHDLDGLYRGDTGYLVGSDPAFRGEEPFLEYLSTSSLSFDPDRATQSLNRIALFLTEAEDQTFVLLRSESPVLPGEELEVPVPLGGQVLCRGLAAVELTFFRGTEEREEWNSREGFDASQRDERFPAAIRLELIFPAAAGGSEGGEGERYATATYLRPAMVSFEGE